MVDEHVRSAIKTVSWRIIATLTTIFLVYIFSSRLILSLSIGFSEVILKLVFYFLHERVWNRIEFGRR